MILHIPDEKSFTLEYALTQVMNAWMVNKKQPNQVWMSPQNYVAYCIITEQFATRPIIMGITVHPEIEKVDKKDKFK